jgi:uncharacterized protein (TIGR03437 family)
MAANSIAGRTTQKLWKSRGPNNLPALYAIILCAKDYVMIVSSCLKLRLIFLILILMAPAAIPGAAATLSASPDNITFNYSPPEPVPNPAFVTITASDGSTPAITLSIAPGTGTPTTLFPQPPVTGDTFQVGIDPNTLNTLVSQGPGIYTATVTVSASGFASLTIPVTLSVSITSSILANPSTLAFTPGGATMQTISLTGNGDTNISFTYTSATSSGGSWLTVSSNANFTPATLTVTVNPLILSTGTYNGTITITPPSPGVSFAIPISVQVGTDTLTATPTSFDFAYTQGSTLPPAQVLQLSSIAPKDTFTVQTTSTGNWLLVNGVTSNVTGSLPASLNVTVNPGTLAPATYTGAITATDANNNTQTITVSLVVSGVSGVANPTSLLFAAETGEITPAPQTVLIEGFGDSSFTATTSGGWLSVSSSSGPAPAQINVTANSVGLAAGTYNGSVVIDLDTHVQTIAVTLVVFAGPVLAASPGDLIFYYSGTNPTGPGVYSSQPVTIDSTSAPEGFTFATEVPSWMQIGPSGTLTTPQTLTVSITPQSLPTGLYVGQVVLTGSTSGAPSTVVPVLLTITNNPAVTASVTSLSFNSTAGGMPQNQTFNVSATTPITFTATPSTSSGGSWLSVSPGSATTGSGNIPMSVTADPTGLTAGAYAGEITLTTSGGVVTQVAVAFNVGASTAPFTVSPSTLTFSYQQNGASPAAQNIQVTGGQAFTAAATTASGGTWLAVTPTSGTGNVTLSVTVSPTTLPAGTYTGTITVTPTGGTAQTISVTLAVTAVAVLSASPNPLAFVYMVGNPAPAAQSLSVTSSGAAIAFTAVASSSGWLSVTPTAGTTPATLMVTINTADIGAGSYSGSIALNSGSTLLFTVNVTLTVTAPLPTITQLVNAASYVGGSISPGEIVVLFGSGLGPTPGVSAAVDSKGYIEGSLANVQVTFNGYTAPLLYVSTSQINAIVPYEMAGTSNASVEVSFGTARSNAITLPVISSSPGVFSANESGTGGGAILDVNYHLVNSSNPVAVGSAIQIYATGGGQTNPAGIDGLVEPDQLPLPYPLGMPGVTIGGLPANVTYAGAAPGLVAGALQVNAVIPPGVPSGNAQVFVSIGGNTSQSGITVAVQ